MDFFKRETERHITEQNYYLRDSVRVPYEDGRMHYTVKYANSYFKTDRKFDTLDDARQFRDICEAKLSQMKFERINMLREDTFREWPENLLADLGIIQENYANYYDEIVPQFETNYEHIRAYLTDREEKCIMMHYKSVTALVDIGNEIGVTRERVSQIIAKALRKLKNHADILTEREKHDLISAEERERMIAEIRETMTLEQAVKIVSEKYDIILKTHDRESVREAQSVGIQTLADMPISELGLTTRSHNALLRAGIRTVQELIETVESSPTELHKIRNLGKKSAEEVVDKMNELFSVDWKCEHGMVAKNGTEN